MLQVLESYVVIPIIGGSRNCELTKNKGGKCENVLTQKRKKRKKVKRMVAACVIFFPLLHFDVHFFLHLISGMTTNADLRLTLADVLLKARAWEATRAARLSILKILILKKIEI